MAPWTLTDIEAAVRAGWGSDTCTPEYRPHWRPDNPARDQCGVTALVVNDLLGGDLLRGEVHVDGARVDYHWWNRLGAGVEVDLTREQFAPHEVVTAPVVVVRPPWVRRCREEYELLRDRVLAALGSTGSDFGPEVAERSAGVPQPPTGREQTPGGPQHLGPAR